MRLILDVALNDLRILFKDRGIWINLVIIPIVIAVVVGYVNGAGNSGAPSSVALLIDVLDLDGSATSTQFLAAVRESNPNLVLCPVDQTEADICRLGEDQISPELIRQRLEDKVSLAFLEIPVGFGDSLNRGEDVTLIYRANENAVAPSYILQAVQSAVTRYGGVQAAAQVGMQTADQIAFLQFSDDADREAFANTIRENADAIWATNPVSVTRVDAVAGESSGGGGGGFAQSIPGIAAMYIMFAVLPVTPAFILERKNWTLQRLAMMPISRSQILGGKLLSRFVLGMIQYGILMGFGVFVLGVNFGSAPLALIAVTAAYIVCVTALALALTTVVTSNGQASGITLFLTLVLAPLGGAWWPLEVAPPLMQTIGHISPIAWFMDGHQQVIFYGGGFGAVVIPIAVLLAMAAVLFLIGVLRFRFTN